MPVSATDNSLVSVIVPCYNVEKCLHRLLDSVLAQTYSPIQLILVNDGSTDGTAAVAESYREMLEDRGISFTLVQQENKGLGGAINAGLLLVEGEYFCWPDADDYLEPESIAHRVEALEAHPEYAVVTSEAYVRDSADLSAVTGMVSQAEPGRSNPNQFKLHLNGDSVFCPGCHMVRTSCFDDVNPMRQIYPARRGQNWQLLLPLYYKYPRLYLSEPLYNYINYPNSMSKDADTLEAHLIRLNEHEEILKQTLRMIEDVQGVNLRPTFSFVEDKYSKLKMEAAIRYRSRDVFEREYAAKQRTVGLDKMDRFAKVRSKSPLIDSALHSAWRILRGGAIENAPEMVIYSKLKLTTEDRPEPLVSVLVPCFNSARFVRTFMSCLLMQSYRNMQVIVVDDGSKDDTYHRLMRYSESFAARRIELMVVRQRNKGAAAAINRALKYVKGEFILLYDSDDVLYRDAIWSKVAFLQDHPAFGMVRSNGYVTNSPFELGRNFFTLEKRQPGAILYDLVRGNAYNWPGSYMVRSGVLFEELGPDKDIYASRYGQNLQIMMPVAGASKCGFINRPQMNYFVHQDSDSSYGGLPRTIERAQGYACNRRAILHSIRISDEERKYLISLVDHDLARKMVDIARESKDKALYERYCGEVYGSAAKAHLKWAGTRIGVDRVWKFCVKVNSHVKRRWGSLLLERHLRALNDAGYDLY